MAFEQLRSLLFVPATNPERVAKARASEADAVIADLEDAVPDAEKNRARESLVAELRARLETVAALMIGTVDLATELGATPDDDEDALRRQALRAKALGYRAKACIHPGQLAAVNEIFSPSDDEVAAARRVVAAYDEAAADGRGAVGVDGEMVDAPVVERARRLLSRVPAERR